MYLVQKSINMEEKHWKKIRKNLIMLKEKLPSELDRIIDYLIQKGIFEWKKKDEIMKHKSNSEKMDKFLGILKTSGPTAYHAFRDALSALGEPYREVVKALEKETDKQKYNWHGTFSNTEQNASASCMSAPENRTSESQQSQLNDLIRLIQQLDQKIDQNHKEGMHQMEEVRRKQDAVSDMTRKYADLQEAYIGLKEQLEKKVERMKKLTKEKEDLKNELQKMKSESRLNLARYNAINKDKERIEKEIFTLRMEIDKLTTDHKKILILSSPTKPRASSLLPPLGNRTEDPHSRDQQQLSWNNNFHK